MSDEEKSDIVGFVKNARWEDGQLIANIEVHESMAYKKISELMQAGDVRLRIIPMGFKHCGEWLR